MEPHRRAQLSRACFLRSIRPLKEARSTRFLSPLPAGSRETWGADPTGGAGCASGTEVGSGACPWTPHGRGAPAALSTRRPQALSLPAPSRRSAFAGRLRAGQEEESGLIRTVGPGRSPNCARASEVAFPKLPSDHVTPSALKIFPRLRTTLTICFGSWSSCCHRSLEP